MLAYWAWLRFTDSPRVRRWADHPQMPAFMRHRHHMGCFFAPPVVGVDLLMLAIAFLPQMPPEGAVWIIFATIVFSGAAVIGFPFRRVLPLWFYPPWLREEKRAQRDKIRANRWWKRGRQS